LEVAIAHAGRLQDGADVAQSLHILIIGDELHDSLRSVSSGHLPVHEDMSDDLQLPQDELVQIQIRFQPASLPFLDRKGLVSRHDLIDKIDICLTVDSIRLAEI